MLRFEIDLDLFGVAPAWQNLVKHDPQLQFAVGLFPEAQPLLDSSRQNRAARHNDDTTPTIWDPAQNIVVSLWPCHNG